MFESDRFFEFAALGSYLVVLLVIGLRAARQSRTSLEYTLAGRSIPWMVVLATTAATMVGGGASLGMTSRVYQFGIAAALITTAWHLQLIFTGIWAAPRLRGLNLITVGDYFELKFGPLAREFSVFNCLVFLIGAIAVQMTAMATITSLILGVPYNWALLIGAAVTVFYSTVGGIRAVVKTDVLQFVVLVGGIGSAAAMLMARNGGWEGMLATVGHENFELTGHWSLTRVVSLFFAFLLGETLVPPYTVRCFIARDSRDAKWGIAGAGLFLLLFLPIATFVMGTAAQFDPRVRGVVEERKLEIQRNASEAGSEVSEEEAHHQAVQIAFPTLVRSTFHPAIAGIMIAALIAAAMSSGDSCLSSLATVVMEDVYRRHISPRASDHHLLRVAQASTLLSGIGATACAYVYPNIADLLEFVYDFWAPSMVVPFMVGLFWYKPTRIYAAVSSMICGLTAAVVWRFAVLPRWELELGPALFGFLIAVFVFFLTLPMTFKIPLTRLFQPHETRERLEGDTP